MTVGKLIRVELNTSFDLKCLLEGSALCTRGAPLQGGDGMFGFSIPNPANTAPITCYVQL